MNTQILSQDVSKMDKKQIKESVVKIAEHIGITKKSLRISCARRELKIYIIDIIDCDIFDKFKSAINSSFGYYNRNANNPAADYPDYRTDLQGVDYISIEWDCESANIVAYMESVACKLKEVIGTNNVIPYAAGLRVVSYPITARDIARMAIYSPPLRKILNGGRMTYNGTNELIIS